MFIKLRLEEQWDLVNDSKESSPSLTQQDWRSHDMTESKRAHTGPSQVQIRWDSKEEVDTEPLPPLQRSYRQLIAAGKGNKCFLSRKSHWLCPPHFMPGSMRHETDSMDFLCAIYFVSVFFFIFLAIRLFCCCWFSFLVWDFCLIFLETQRDIRWGWVGSIWKGVGGGTRL